MNKLFVFKKLTVILTGIILFSGNLLFSQEIPKNYFRFPTDEPILLSGSFGELRTTHFHAGIDIKSGGVVGGKVYAIADGYVSHVRVSASGYGNMLYVAHPNGFVSTYAHLLKFNDSIANYVEKLHYSVQRFELDTAINPTVFPVKKGDVIGYIGNTGSSAGPHLHFEIRDEKKESAFNPLLFGLNVKDHKKPRLFKLSVYPIGENASVNKSKKRIDIPVAGGTTLKTAILASGTVGFGIVSDDLMDITSHTYGLFAIKLFANDSLIYHASWDKFTFTDQRYILAHIDFNERQLRGTKIQQLFVLPGNKLQHIYKQVANNGLVDVKKNDTINFRLVVADATGNENKLSFKIVGIEPAPLALPDVKQADARNSQVVFHYNKKNSFKAENFKIEVPDSALYTDINFEYSEILPENGNRASVHSIQNKYVPLQKQAKIYLAHPVLDSIKLQKLYIARNLPTGFGVYTGGKLEHGYVSCLIKEFGNYTLKIDSLPPRITALNFTPGKLIRPGSQLAFRISDLETGIGTYNAYINNNWVLLNFDAKSARVWYVAKKQHFNKGKNTLLIRVTDKVGNVKEYTANFISN